LDPIGVGVIGLGFVASGAHLPSLKAIPNAKIVALSDIDEARLKKMAKKFSVSDMYTDYKELLKKPAVEAVIVSIPTPFHHKVVIDAAEAGKHILCEMPLAPTLEEADQMIAAADKAGVKLMPSLNFRFTPNYVKAKELIESGGIGKPEAVLYKEFIPAEDLARQWPPGSWVWDLEKSGGPLYTLAVWSIDLLRWLLKSEITKVDSAVSTVKLDHLGGTLGYTAVAALTFTSGAISSLQFSGSVIPALGTSSMEIIGSNTNVIATTGNNSVALYEKEPDRTEWLYREPGHRAWGHMQMDEHFVQCISENRSPTIKPEDGRIAVEVAQKIAKIVK